MNSIWTESHICLTHFSKLETIPFLANELLSPAPEVEGICLSQATVKQVLVLL